MSFTPSAAERASKERKGRFGLGCFLVFLTLFGFGMAGVFLWPIVQSLNASDWRKTPCTILTSEVRTHSDSDGSTYSVEVTYRYEVDGRDYVGTRYKFMVGSSSGYDGKRAIVDQLPPGQETFCWVNRRNPSEAVLERGFTVDVLAGFIPLLFGAIGLVGLVVVFVVRPKRKAAPTFATPAPVGAPGAARPVALKASVSPGCKFFGALAICLFWNGIVSIFVVQAFFGSERNSGCAKVFILPFVAVGAGLAVWVIYQFLALFNPRPALRLSSSSVALGDAIELEWETVGNVDRVKTFQIVLEGREEATYRRGTSTVTDKSVFATIELVSSPRGKEMRRGKVKVAIPADTMHSFKSAHNKILWHFRVKGDIPRWPDVNEEFPVEIRPAPVAPGGAA